MKKALALLAVVLTLGAATVPFDADAARRLGGGKSTGMQRQNTAPPANTPPAGNNATQGAPSQAATPAGAAAAPPQPQRLPAAAGWVPSPAWPPAWAWPRWHRTSASAKRWPT
jgi:hypothetical protein